MQGIEILLVSVLVAFTQGNVTRFGQLWAKGTNSSQFSNWRSSWIEGGSVAAAGEFPFLVSLRIVPEDKHHCGGTIINERFILTSAYCVIRFPTSSVIAVVGTNTLNTGGKKHKISGIFTHHHFRSVGMIKDIALLKLMHPIALSPRAHPIILPNQDEIVDLGTVCDFSGWGITSENAPYSNNLLKLQISIVPSTECLPYNSYFDDTKLCARAAPGTGVCKGDAGGPLICGGKLAGILTGGGTTNTLCKTGFPLDFVYVSKYIKWIIDTVM